MKKLWGEFKKFIKRGNVVDMAVGVAVATAFTKIVNAFTAGFISPLIALIVGESDLASMKYIVRPELLDADGVTVIQKEVAILWGAFVQTIIDFLIIAVVMFTVMQIAAALNRRAERIAKEVREKFAQEEIAAQKAAEAEAKAKADAEAAAKAEAEALAKAEAEAKIKAEEDRLVRQEELLRDIRDLLKERK